MSTIMNYLFKKLNIKVKTVAPFSYQSLQEEHGIKSLSLILTKHLTEPRADVAKILALSNVGL